MQTSKHVGDFPRGKSQAHCGHVDPRAPRVVRGVPRASQDQRDLLRGRRLTFLAGWLGGISCALVTLWLFRHGGTLCGALGMLALQLGGASIILGYVCSDMAPEGE